MGRIEAGKVQTAAMVCSVMGRIEAGKVQTAAMVCSVLISVHFYAFSILSVAITEYFDVSKALTGTIASLNVAVFFAVGEFTKFYYDLYFYHLNSL